MNIQDAECLIAHWIEEKVINVHFSGAQKFAVLFALPFKVKQLEQQILLNAECAKSWGIIGDDNIINIDFLEKHTVETMEKCGGLPIDFTFKTITFDASDIKDLFAYIRSNC